jgi:hypothetical protein
VLVVSVDLASAQGLHARGWHAVAAALG